MEHIASVDIGTTNIKINLFNQSLSVTDTVVIKHQNNRIQDQIFEMDFEEVWHNVSVGLNRLIQRNQCQSLEIILTTAMHSVQLMDDEYNLQGNVLTWADRRGVAALENMSSDQREKQYYRTGTPLHSMNPYVKLLNVYTKGSKIGSLKDLLFYRLTGEWAIDVNNASGSGLFNIEKFVWDEESLSQLGIEQQHLPMIKSINYSLPVTDNLLDIEARVIIGTSDGISSNYVFNNLSKLAVLSIGTSHAVRVVHNQPILNYDYQNFSYVIDDVHHLIGLPSNNGADVLSWIIKFFNTSYEELNEIVINRPETPSIFLPFLNGERAPLWQDDATASLYHLSRTSTRESIIYAMILGMLFNIKQNVVHLSELVKFEAIGLVGGITNLNDFPQLIADVLNYPLYVPKMKNAETLGSINVCKNIIARQDYTVIKPDEAKSKEFTRLYDNYQVALDKHLH